MTGRLLSLLERLPSWARRGLMIALPLALLGFLVVGFALAPRPASTNSGRAASTRLLPPRPAAAGHAPGRPAPPAETGQSHGAGRSGLERRLRGRSHVVDRPPVRGPVSERPSVPVPGSPAGMMLAVARRFAVAYMPYQVGRLPRWARTAFARTCTPGFARYLLAQPARPTALQAAHPRAIETYRVSGVAPAEGADMVAVGYVSAQDSADTGELLLRLVREHGRWLVASLEA